MWMYFYRTSPSNLTPATCTADSNCASGYYCGGGGICVKGTSGRTVGQVCTTTSQCEVGLNCNSGICQISSLPILNPLVPFDTGSTFADRIGASSSNLGTVFGSSSSGCGGSNISRRRRSGCDNSSKYDDSSECDDSSGCGVSDSVHVGSFDSKFITTTVSGIRYNLVVTSSGSSWTTTNVSQTYSYNASTQQLTSNGRIISINSSGNLFLLGTPSTGIGANVIIMQTSGGFIMDDRYGNTLSVMNQGNRETYFPDRSRYPTSPIGRSYPVRFEIL